MPKTALDRPFAEDDEDEPEEQPILVSPAPRTCRVCGCDDEHACMTDGVPCHWIAADLCSACRERAR